jgi:head-tail adaptor
VTHVFTIRYLSGMDTGKRIYFDSRYFTPLSVRNTDERDYKMEIEAREDTDA